MIFTYFWKILGIWNIFFCQKTTMHLIINILDVIIMTLDITWIQKNISFSTFTGIFKQNWQNMDFFNVFLQKQWIEIVENPLTIQIFHSQRTPNVFVLSSNEKKNYCVILINKVFMTDFRPFLSIFLTLNEKISLFSKFHKLQKFSLIIKSNTFSKKRRPYKILI